MMPGFNEMLLLLGFVLVPLLLGGTVALIVFLAIRRKKTDR